MLHKILRLQGRRKIAVACVTCLDRCKFTNDPERIVVWIDSHVPDGDTWTFYNEENDHGTER